MPAPSTTTETCSKCGGVLIGAEPKFGTCGHCGGRSIRPKSARRQIATATFDHYPDGRELSRLEELYREEGYGDPQAVPMPANDRERSWDVKIFAVGNPYREDAQ